IPALGGTERRLGQFQTPFYFGSSLSWSPDGKFLASAEAPSRQNPYGIFLLSAETGDKRRLTSPPPGTMDLFPVFSPDGQALAFGGWRSEFVGDLYVLSVAGNTPRGEPRRLTFDDRTIGGLDWAPDGRRLIFSSNRGGSGNLGSFQFLEASHNSW